MTTRKHWPVVIVGACPTGLTLAGLLGRYGVDLLVVERNLQTVQEPRAVSIDDESLRTMQSVGIVNDLVPHIVLGYGSEYFSPRGRSFLKVKPSTLEYGYPRRNAFRQPILEQLLRDNLSRFSNVTALFETELVGFAQSEKGVTLDLRSIAAPLSVSCDYLIACDGSRSFVRQTLGVGLHGSTFKERWLIIDLEGTTDRTRDTKVYCNPKRPCLSLPGPRGTRRFEYMLRDGEADDDVLAPDRVAALLRLYGNDNHAVLRRKVVYTFHARMAERWRNGRILLAGDAAHLMPPFAGQGMNSGVRDAHNLAWKIAAVVSGYLGSDLLDSYETERREHVAAMTQLAIRMGQVMMPRNRLQAFAVQTFFRSLALYPAARSYFAEMKYKPKPRFHRGFLLAEGPTKSLIGRLFPQPVVMTRAGVALLDDVLGDGFALLAPPGTSPQLLRKIDLGALGLPIRAVAVLDKEDASPMEPPVIAARDLRGELAKLLSGQPSGLYLLRPDRYVAGFFPLKEASAVVENIAGIVRATWPKITSASAVRSSETVKQSVVGA
jgi:3-(3-hydroxy-phenyl)propionate hydroxylase